MLLWGDLQVLGTEFDFAAVTAGTHLGQGLWAVALAAAGLIVFATARLRTRIIAVVLVVLGAVAAVAVLPERYADAHYLDPGATALVCTADTPRVCVMRAHQAALADLRGPGREALAILAAKLPDAPTNVVEMPYGDPPPARADTIPIALLVSGDGRDIQSATGTAPDIRWELLLGAGTPGCANAPAVDTAERRRYDIARLVAAAWLLDQEPQRRQTRPTRRCSSRARPCPPTRRWASCRQPGSGPGSPSCAKPSWPATAATGWTS
jgi:hypothetical protein